MGWTPWYLMPIPEYCACGSPALKTPFHCSCGRWKPSPRAAVCEVCAGEPSQRQEVKA
jgi:hypothetical protein